MVMNVRESSISVTPMKVDREAGIIYRVKVCGKMSRNGRNYSQALERAVPLYERKRIYLDHGAQPGAERKLEHSFGVIKSVRFEDGEIYGDLHYLKSHPMSMQIVEQAERFPETFGLSHDADIDGKVDASGVFQVTEIIAVRSVDLVTEPATASGIYESIGGTITMKKTIRAIFESLPAAQYPGRYRVLEQMDGEQLNGKPVTETEVEVATGGSTDEAILSAFKSAILAAFEDPALDTKATIKKIGELVKMHEKLTMKADAPADPPAAPATEAEDDKAPEELKAMQESMKHMLAKFDAQEKRETAITVLESRGLPRTSPLLPELAKLADRAAMEKHIDSAGLGHGFQSFGGGGGIYGAMESAASGEGDPSKPKTRDELKAAFGIRSKN